MIEILSTGGLTTIQDAGRFGYRRFGIGVSGAVDALAADVGNAMLGNTPDAAFVEVLLFPVRMRFHVDCQIALTGADARATLDARALWPWWCLPVKAGQTLSLTSPSTGGAAYVCVSGGIDVPLVLGSRSTDLKAGFGGFMGRPLRKGDKIGLARPHVESSAARGDRKFGVIPPVVALGNAAASNTDAAEVRFLPAAEWDSFDAEAQSLLVTTPWKISPTSNRIGCRLDGPELKLKAPMELLSHGIVPGVMQVPPSGQPIVMQCDAQTSGGYPKIGTVIEADQWRVAQTPIGGSIRFRMVSLDDAMTALHTQKNYLQHVRRSASAFR